MSSFLKSALNYVNNYNSNDDFLGSNVDLGQQKLYVSSIIAEGLFYIKTVTSNLIKIKKVINNFFYYFVYRFYLKTVN